jgi:hypothetical protein
MMEMDPQDPKTIYAGTRENGMIYTLDKAETWQQPRDEALKTGAINDIEVNPKQVCTVYVAKSNKLIKTADCFRTIDPEMYVEPRAGVQVSRVEVDWFNPEVVWLGLSNGDVAKSENGGKTWRTILKDTKGSIAAIMVSNTDSRTVFIGTTQGGLQKTTDGGATWTKLENSLKPFKNSLNVLSLIQDKTGKEIFFTSQFGILKSTDLGETWTDFKLLTSAGELYVRPVGIDQNNTKTVYYASGSTFYVSENGGINWDSELLPPSFRPEAMLVDPTDAKVIYIGVASTEKK